VSKKPSTAPWYPVPYDVPVSAAIKALASGTANEGQQKRALDWIINVACGTYDQPYRPDSDRDTAFACGRQFVEQQIVKQIKIVPVAKP